MLVFSLIVAALLVAVVVQHSKVRRAAREAHIRAFIFPQGLFAELKKKRPELTHKDCELVAHALRQFFLAHLNSGRQFVSMPSQVVDELWHAFILHTRTYEQFCKQAFGRFLHHSPAVVLKDAQKSDAGLWRCWFQACKEEHISPYKPTRLPLLFALDAKLKLADGFVYALDCRAPTAHALGAAAAGTLVVHCAADLKAGRDSGGGCGGGGSTDSGGDDGGGGGGDGGCGGGGCGS